jgi:hypothetical protein
MSNQNKTLAERLAEARAESPLKDMTAQQAAVRATNELKRGVPTNKVTKGAFKEGNVPHNKGKSGNWGETRKERAEQMSEEERRAYFGYHEHHTEETKQKQAEKATERWSDPEARKAHSERLKGKKKPKIKCEYCGKEMSAPNLKRHGHTEGKCVK